MRWKFFAAGFMLIEGIAFSQQRISGKIQSEDGDFLNAVLIVDMATNERWLSDDSGNFSVFANPGDELRFIRTGFVRKSHTVSSGEVSQPLVLILTRLVQEIEPVKILHLSGNLARDSKTLQKENPMDRVNKEIGVPAPPEKPREVPPPTIKQVGVVRYVASNLNLNNLYKNISGDARKMRSLYKYEDEQDKVKWIRDRTTSDFFTEAGIPESKINECIQFAIASDPQISQAVKEKNIDKALLNFETVFALYLKKMTKK